MGVFSQAKPPLRRDNDEGYHLVRSPLVPQAAQVVRFVRLPRGEAPLVRVGPEGQAPPHHWHWPHAVPEGRLAPFQERPPRGHHRHPQGQGGVSSSVLVRLSSLVPTPLSLLRLRPDSSPPALVNPPLPPRPDLANSTRPSVGCISVCAACGAGLGGTRGECGAGRTGRACACCDGCAERMGPTSRSGIRCGLKRGRCCRKKS